MSRKRFRPETIEAALQGDHPYALNRRDRRAIASHQRHHPQLPPEPPQPQEPSVTKPKRIILDIAERDQLNTLLKQWCARDADGYAVYTGGQNDASIAAMLPFSCTDRNVEGSRKALIGELRPVDPPSPETIALRAQVAELRSQYEALWDWALALSDELKAARPVVVQ